MTELCEAAGCPQLASHSTVLMIPAKDWPLESHQPIQFWLKTRVCLTHAKADTAPGLLARNPKLVEIIRQASRAANPGGAKPDFERAYIEAIELAGPRYQALTAFVGKSSTLNS